MVKFDPAQKCCEIIHFLSQKFHEIAQHGNISSNTTSPKAASFLRANESYIFKHTSYLRHNFEVPADVPSMHILILNPNLGTEYLAL